jgi:hypothetical protein
MNNSKRKIKESLCSRHFQRHKETLWNSHQDLAPVIPKLILYKYIYICIYTGCPGRNVNNFGGAFLMLKYTDITQNTYIQSWTVTEIMTREKCGLLCDYTHFTCQLTTSACPPFSVVSYYISRSLSKLHTFRLIRRYSSQISCTVSGWRQRWAIHVVYSVWNPTDNNGTITSVFVVQFNGFMSVICYVQILTLLKPHIPTSFNMNLVISMCVTAVKVSNL